MIPLYTLEVFGSVVGVEGSKLLPLAYVVRERTCISQGVRLGVKNIGLRWERGKVHELW